MLFIICRCASVVSSIITGHIELYWRECGSEGLLEECAVILVGKVTSRTVKLTKFKAQTIHHRHQTISTAAYPFA